MHFAFDCLSGASTINNHLGDLIGAVAIGAEGAAIEAGHHLEHTFHVTGADGFIARVHCQLRQANINGIDRNMAHSDMSQG